MRRRQFIEHGAGDAFPSEGAHAGRNQSAHLEFTGWGQWPNPFRESVVANIRLGRSGHCSERASVRAFE